jgi:pimeloyl-ACP methyl ester carboxylesterase
MLVRGRMSDVVTIEGVESFRSDVPTAEFVDVSGAGHMVAGDRNDAFTDAVVDFLQRHRK